MDTYHLPRGLRYIKKFYPSWGVLVERLLKRDLKASDVKRILGLSYRQLNDWEERGILKSRSREAIETKKRGWRKFSIIDLIPLGILKGAKSQGFEITRFQEAMGDVFFFQSFASDEFPNIVYGLDAFFLTNLSNMFGFHYIDPKSSSEILDSWIPGLRESEVIIFINLIPIIDNIFKRLEAADFEAIKKPEGGHRFNFNGEPLELEELPPFKNELEVK